MPSYDLDFYAFLQLCLLCISMGLMSYAAFAYSIYVYFHGPKGKLTP